MRGFPSAILVLGSLTALATAQWSTPALVASVNSPVSEYSPMPTFNGLTLYFTVLTSSAHGEIYRATRTTPYGAFSTPVHVTELSSPQEEWSPWVRFDEREI